MFAEVNYVKPDTLTGAGSIMNVPEGVNLDYLHVHYCSTEFKLLSL